MLGRPILYRQVGYRFYRPAAFAVAAVFADIPFNASNIVCQLLDRSSRLHQFLFTIILYFMGGLYASAGAYFMFFLFIFLVSHLTLQTFFANYQTFLVMSSFFRLLGVATSDYNVAARLASVLICELPVVMLGTADLQLSWSPILVT
jgi:ATP-binding cassette subfamily G (WHITE) protein 2 (SNQ2)